MTEHRSSQTDARSATTDSVRQGRIDTSTTYVPRIASGDIPPVLDVPQAARLLGIGRTLAYELIRTNQWPTPVVRMGRLIKIPSGPIMELMTTGSAAHRQAG